jgi:hypothetical protein
MGVSIKLVQMKIATYRREDEDKSGLWKGIKVRRKLERRMSGGFEPCFLDGLHDDRVPHVTFAILGVLIAYSERGA